MKLTHLNEKGKAHMVDVSGKSATTREAVAAGEVQMQPQTLALIQQNIIEKGDVLAVARVAGIMASKRTADLIPLCHPLSISKVTIDFTVDTPAALVNIVARVHCHGATGVEMEALTAVSVAALTIYDMCKAVDRAMHIQNIRLIEKHGGKSGDIVLETLNEG